MILAAHYLCPYRILCHGTDALVLYSEMHQSTMNQIIHGLGMPFVAYGVFGGFPILMTFLLRHPDYQIKYAWDAIRWTIYFGYVLYYMTFDMIGAFFCAILFFFPLAKAKDMQRSLSVTEYKYAFWHFLSVLVASILVQEGIGHTFFEGANSDLWQLPNSINISPLFGTRALMHNFLGFDLIP